MQYCQPQRVSCEGALNLAMTQCGAEWEAVTLGACGRVNMCHLTMNPALPSLSCYGS